MTTRSRRPIEAVIARLIAKATPTEGARLVASWSSAMQAFTLEEMQARYDEQKGYRDLLKTIRVQ